MGGILHSLLTLALAFGGVAATTLALALVLVPGERDAAPVGDRPATTPVAEAPTLDPSAPVTTVGGVLAVSGDRNGSLRLDRERRDDRYGLVGDGGRILFDENPFAVARIQYDGLEFFVDADDCTVTPGERHDPTGVAAADLECRAIEDVRGNGTVSVAGRLGVAADLLGLRGGLPESGGTMSIGDETFTVPAARFQLPSFTGAFAGQLTADDGAAAISFRYDAQTHEIAVNDVIHGGEHTVVPGGCAVSEDEIGLLNPHTRVVGLTVRCDRVEIPALGEVPIRAEAIVELVDPLR